MANTIMTAKNTFAEGLIMDFAPDNTQATCMTSALNATLLTFNGNEMSLLNDMGNGRVETAYLPEGYVPVGTCEFGDIIYIVSYNPLTNKSQIGCFPSPERNISSDELGGLGLSLSWLEFLESSDGTITGYPTGNLKTSSIKKIIYDNRDMTPGDKYIIYSDDLTENNTKYLSDFGNPTHKHGTFPKLVKIHIVSIEESGKIVYLDSTTKWYDIGLEKDNTGQDIVLDYYLNYLHKSADVKDLDSYRTMVNSAYSIFSSKVSGKLALLIELEKITGFSCSWEPYVASEEIVEENSDITYTNYNIYWHFNWTTDNNNINPSKIILTESEWSGIDANKGKYQKWEKILNGEETNNIKLSKNWIEVDPLPTKYKVNEGKEKINYWNITRKYVVEDEDKQLSFSDFIEEYEYTSYLNNTIKDIKNSIIDSKNEKLPDPYKLNIFKDLGIPLEGKYLINCNNVINLKYYTSSLTGSLVEIKECELLDDIVNNYFHYPVIKLFNYTFKIPTELKITYDKSTITKTPNINNLIYHYKLAPAMPYGILAEYTQEGYIDFSKIGKKNIAINTWKYYNYENTSTLTWGMEAYTEPGKGISEVVFEFYDNQGFVAAYHNKNKLSYNGTFTEYITFNESGSNYKLNNIKAFPESLTVEGIKIDVPTYHRGNKISKDLAVSGFKYQKVVQENLNNEPWINYEDLEDNSEYYLDDSGTLYPNCLYLVKIIIKYCNKGILDEYEPVDPDNPEQVITEYRWFWTNRMFNKHYYDTKDFKILLFSLGLDGLTIIETIPEKWSVLKVNYFANDNYDTPINAENPYSSLSAIVLYINQNDNEDNLRLAIRSGLIDTYNTFNIDSESLNLILATVYTADHYVENFPEQPKVLFSEKDDVVFEGIYPIVAENLTGVIDNTISKTLYNLINNIEEDESGDGSEGNTGGDDLEDPIGGGGPPEVEEEGGIEEGDNPIALVENNETEWGPELYDSETSYKNYPNNYLLEFSENLLEGTILENERLLYLQSKDMELSLEKEWSSVKCPDISIIYYDEENKKIDPDKCIKLRFKGIHYSKFYYFNSLETSLVKVLRSFVADAKDLQKYALDIYGDKIRYSKMYLCAVRDRNGTSNRYVASVVKFNENNTLTEIVDTRIKEIGKEDYPILEGLDFTQDLILNNFNFLFPLGFGHDYNPSGNSCPASLNGVRTISSNRQIKEGATYSEVDLGGTLAGITNNGGIEPGNHMQSGNSLTDFVGITLGYLTLLFYIQEATEELSNYLPSNYAFLEDNYSQYTRDIVLKLKTKKEETSEDPALINEDPALIDSKIINILGLKYYDYLISLLSNVFESNFNKDEFIKKEPNVCLSLESCLKTNPISIKFDYIRTSLASPSLQNKIIIKSLFKEIDNNSILQFTPGEIYYYDFINKQFNNIRNGTILKTIYNYNIDENNLIVISNNDNNRYMDITTIKNNLAISVDTLTWKSFPIKSSTNVYRIKTSEAGGGEGSRWLSNFKYGLKFYN